MLEDYKKQLEEELEEVNREIFVIEKGSVLIKDEKIEWVGRAIDFNFGLYGDEVEIVDATGKVVLPGFVDSHTHLVFAGTRESSKKVRYHSIIHDIKN
ncbi:Amidohydrolase family protein [Candidatus Kryptonium thompsonii]|nr:Amidohydrolase family protein [Candidatus Kryptonium thompsoni]